MEIQDDCRELLGLFNANGVEYLVVGAHALAYHGAPRSTGDLDVLIRPTKENARRVLTALDDFGFGSLDIEVADLSSPDRVLQLGVAPARVDLITSITGVDWETAYDGRVRGNYGDVEADFLGRAELIRNKRETGRRKDLADLEALGEE